MSGPKTTGWLRPGSDPMPKDSCAAGLAKRDPKGMIFLLGGSVAAGMTSDFPRDVLVVKDIPRLVVDRDPKSGNITVTLDVFGADGKIVASIERNQFTVNPNNYFKMVKPDPSTLRVVDQYNKEVLNVRYLNRHAIKLEALLYYPGLDDPIEIKDDALSMGDYVVADNCSYNLGQVMAVLQIRSSKPHPYAAIVF